MTRSTKKEIFLDTFIKRYCCSAKNHPQGWSWWKRKNRKDTRRKFKNELKREVDDYES